MEVELCPVRYELALPSAGDPDEWDANWLVVRGVVRLADERRWRFEDACLTTWEARRLGRWLRGAAAVDATPPPGGDHRIEFTEPNLALRLTRADGSRRDVEVRLSQESCPPWAPRRARFSGFTVTIRAGAAELLRAAEEWERELASFPQR